MAAGRVFGNCDRMMVTMAKIGTAKNIPGIPQTIPHMARDEMMKIGLRFRLLPIKYGSRIWPRNAWDRHKHPKTMAKIIGSPNWIRAMADGSVRAINDPA